MDDIGGYVRRIAESCPEIFEIWLIGSRAHGTWKSNSDVDLLVFVDLSFISEVRENTALHRDDVDCLVMVGVDRFQSAWGEKLKGGSLSGWNWRKLSDQRAMYSEVKWRDAEAGAGFAKKDCIGIRKWPPP